MALDAPTTCLLHARRYRAVFEELLNTATSHGLLELHQLPYLRSTRTGLCSCADRCGDLSSSSLPEAAEPGRCVESGAAAPGPSGADWLVVVRGSDEPATAVRADGGDTASTSCPQDSRGAHPALTEAVRAAQARLESLASKHGQRAALARSIEQLYDIVAAAAVVQVAPEVVPRKKSPRQQVKLQVYRAARQQRCTQRPARRRGSRFSAPKAPIVLRPYAQLRWPPARFTMGALQGQRMQVSSASPPDRDHMYDGLYGGAPYGESDGLEPYLELADEFEDKLCVAASKHGRRQRSGRKPAKSSGLVLVERTVKQSTCFTLVAALPAAAAAGRGGSREHPRGEDKPGFECRLNKHTAKVDEHWPYM